MNLPARIGPVEFDMLGGMVAVRCPHARMTKEAEALLRGRVAELVT